MPLDLVGIVQQLDHLSQSVREAAGAKETRLSSLLEAAAGISNAEAAKRTAGPPERPFLAARVTGALLGAHQPPDPPPAWFVAAVDGSHIDVDRHLPVHCFLLNFGGCVLTYGADARADFFSRASLHSEPPDLYIVDSRNPNGEETVSGPLLGLVRTVKELETLADTVEVLEGDNPVLALVDGSLVLWGLSGQGYRPFVRDAIIRDGLLPALERLEALAARRAVATAAYVSYPRSTEVVNAVRSVLCPHPQSVCVQSCNNRRSALAPCSQADDFLDRDLFEPLLQPGWRSPVYQTNSSVPRDHYGEAQQVYFFYLNAGEEIGRVEVPAWVARDEGLLSLTHALLWDQCRRGQGYPVAISESHEQAVVTGSDRRAFRRMLTDSLARQGVAAATSQKDRSKRMPWL